MDARVLSYCRLVSPQAGRNPSLVPFFTQFAFETFPYLQAIAMQGQTNVKGVVFADYAFLLVVSMLLLSQCKKLITDIDNINMQSNCHQRSMGAACSSWDGNGRGGKQSIELSNCRLEEFYFLAYVSKTEETTYRQYNVSAKYPCCFGILP